MEQIKLHIGTKTTTRSGVPQDRLRPVVFEAEQLASRTEYIGSGDSRGITKTLYKTPDNRYVVYVENWSRWQGETSSYKLIEATLKDLQVEGRFEQLGRQANIARPLTLDEALSD